MKNTILISFALLLMLTNCTTGNSRQKATTTNECQPKKTEINATAIPHLEKVGNKIQLVVNEKPFIILGGELGNSTGTTKESMQAVWDRMTKLNVNTILAPIYWELIEPEENKFNFTSVDDLITGANAHNLKLVFLWFGSWKNSMSSHAPAWVKLDKKRFPLAKSKTGKSQEILTPFSENNLNADLNAYKNLMQHIKAFDTNQTVILMQPENEIGMLPSARDYCDLANAKFNANVPQKLIDYLVKNKEKLNPEFKKAWAKNGFKTEGNWEQIFGKSVFTDEFFMAYYYADFTNKIAEAGKKEYNIPVYVNAALNWRPQHKHPGDYPSAGPLPHILDIWMAASPDIDFYSPDFYNPNLKHWCDLYTRQENQLFIPEHIFDQTAAAKALYAFGHYETLGFSPFAIEQNPGTPFSAKEKNLAKVYDMISQVKPLLDKNRGKNRIEGVLLDNKIKKVDFILGDYKFHAKHTFNLGWEPNSNAEVWQKAGAIIIQTEKNEFYYVGSGISLTFTNTQKPDSTVGILKTDLGYFKNDKWMVLRHLNGDQTHQGRHIRSFINDFCIQRFTLYEYQ